MDKILEKFFELERWEYAIDKGLGKGISKATLYQLTKPETRVAMYEAIRDGKYEIAPPHTAKIPKIMASSERFISMNRLIEFY